MSEMSTEASEVGEASEVVVPAGVHDRVQQREAYYEVLHEGGPLHRRRVLWTTRPPEQFTVSVHQHPETYVFASERLGGGLYRHQGSS